MKNFTNKRGVVRPVQDSNEDNHFALTRERASVPARDPFSVLTMGGDMAIDSDSKEA